MAREGAGTLFTVTFTWCPDLHILLIMYLYLEVFVMSGIFVISGICYKWYLSLCLQLTVFVFHGHFHLVSRSAYCSSCICIWRYFYWGLLL